VSSGEPNARADVLVIFGISGDLAKVMTFRSLYRLEQRGLINCPIVGVAVDDWSVDQLREHARTAIENTGRSIDEAVFKRFAHRLSYVRGDFTDEAMYARVGTAMAGAQRPVFYLEIPPALFATVIKGLSEAGLTTQARVVVEKPFGHDLESARALASEIHQYLAESQLYRIDHFLGKMGLDEFLYLEQGELRILERVSRHRRGGPGIDDRDLRGTQTELRLVFHRPPRLGFIEGKGMRLPVESQLVLKIDPTTGIRLIVDAHRADRGEPQEITLKVEFAQEGGEGPTPYEVLLQAAIEGDSAPFTRQDRVAP